VKQTEHGCYDCRRKKSACGHCDILQPTPTKWKPGRIDGSIRNAFESLNAAVIKQAVQEYRAARKAYRKNRSLEALETMRDVERFFRSDQCARFMNLDGNTLMDRLKQEGMST